MEDEISSVLRSRSYCVDGHLDIMRPSKIFPILQNGMRSVTRRPLHTTPRVFAGPRLQKGGAKQKVTRTRSAVPSHTTPDALPPLSVLEHHYLTGHYDMKPSTALDFLKQYQLLSHQATAGWEQGLCKSQLPISNFHAHSNKRLTPYRISNIPFEFHHTGHYRRRLSFI
jgi:hypothetical protein